MEHLQDIEKFRALLKPYVTLAENLDKAIEAENQLRVTRSSYTQEIPLLKDEQDKLQHEINMLSQQVVKDKAAHGELMRKQMESATKDQQELKAKVDVLKTQLSTLESTHTKRVADTSLH